jgi:predicted ATPase
VADGACFVPLASLLDPTLLPSRILEALGLLEDAPERFLEGTSSTGLDLLKASLSEQERLLVLDSFEHLLEASTVVAELLAAAPRLKVLVTSQVVLHLYGEHTWEVPPLELVDPHHLPELAALGRCPAIRLFVERAQALKPAFVLTEHNAAVVAELCAHLDGLPLAIELAAARIKLFSPNRLLEQLSGKDNSSPHQGSRSKEALTFLRQNTRNVPERQQTLWKTLDWSYQLLESPARHLLTQLGVFQGGWTVEAAQAVCLGEPDLSEVILDRLEALVNQSLIVYHPMEEDGAAQGQFGRFSLLEIVQRYVLARLSESGQMQQVQRHHAQYYLALVESSEPDLYGGARQRTAIRLLEREQDNIRTALAFAVEQGEAEVAQRFCSAFFLFWGKHDQTEEGLHWLETTRLLGGEMSQLIGRKLVLAKGWLLLRQGAYECARTLLEESFALSADGVDLLTRAFILRNLGESWYLQGEYAQAASSFEVCLEWYRASGDQEHYALVLARMGVIYQLQGDESRAESMLSESVSLLRAGGQRAKLFIALADLSGLEASQGKLIQALEHMREALFIGQEIGYRLTIGPSIALALIECASYLAALQAPEHAAQLGGAAEALLERRGATLPDLYYRRYMFRLERLKAQANEAKWAVWWREGRALSQEQGIMLALQASQEMLSH